MAYIILRVVNCSHGDSVNVYFPGTFELGDEEQEEIYEVINISLDDTLKRTGNQVEIITFYSEYFQFVHLYDDTDYCIIASPHYNGPRYSGTLQYIV